MVPGFPAGDGIGHHLCDWFARMERRKDYRHRLKYCLSLKCPRSEEVRSGLWTDNVSASGLYYRFTDENLPEKGSALEVRLVAWPESPNEREVLVLGTRAEVIRIDQMGVALCFDAPLAF